MNHLSKKVISSVLIVTLVGCNMSLSVMANGGNPRIGENSFRTTAGSTVTTPINGGDLILSEDVELDEEIGVASPSNGGVQIPQKEIDEATPANANWSMFSGHSIVAAYEMDYADGYLEDVTGNGFDAELVGFTEADFSTDGLRRILTFDGTDKYIKLPRGIITQEAFTIEAVVKTGVNANHWLWTIGTNENIWPNVTNYLFVNPRQGNGTLRAGINSSNSGERLFQQNTTLRTSKYSVITVTFEEGTLSLYVDYELCDTIETDIEIMELIENGTDPMEDVIGYIGKSLYTPDPLLKANLASFCVWDYALTEDEMVDDAAALQAALDELEIPNQDDIRGNITLLEETSNGAHVEWSVSSSGEDIISITAMPAAVATYRDNDEMVPAGKITRPDDDTQFTLTATVTYGSEQSQKTFDLTVKAAPEPLDEDELTDYFFSYFAGERYENGEQVYFAASRDGLNWVDLNDNQPVLEAEYGEEGVRDPYIIRSPEGDKFYMIATDLKIHGNGDWSAAQRRGSQSLVVWESTDLVDWDQQRLVEISVGINAGCTWAPEAMYDEVTGEYIVFWASRIADDNYAKQRIYYAKTRDFYTFTEPKVYIDKESDTIDTTMLYEDGYYYRFSKNERRSNIIADRVETLLYDEPEDLSYPTLEAQGGVEGPTIIKLHEEDTDYRYCMLVDNYGGIGYYPLVSNDLDSDFVRITEGFRMPGKARHGTPLRITEDEYMRVIEEWGDFVSPNDEEPQENPVLEYTFDELAGSVIHDMAGNNDGTLYGAATIGTDGSEPVLLLDGSDGSYAAFPQGFFDGRNTFTISMDIKSEMDNQNSFTFAIGKNTDRYMFLRTRANQIRFAATRGSWNGEQDVKTQMPVKGLWKNVKIAVTADSMKLFVDGVLVDENLSINTAMTDYGSNVLAYLGKSFYDGDVYFKGMMDNVQVYNRALSEREIADQHGVTLKLVKDLELDSPGYTASAVAKDYERKEAVVYISKNNSSNARPTTCQVKFILTEGATVNGGSVADISMETPQAVTVTLDDISEEWTIRAVWSNNPVLGGQFADPDIDVLDGKFYIYPTTDGFPGWSGTQFHAFSSEDMVDWTDEGIILDVADNNPGTNINGIQIANVPWAIGSAWAPTIEEKDGKYYYYFCAKRQNGDSCIGVAVADDPAGPFVAEAEPLITPDICRSDDVDMGQTIDPSIYQEDGKYYVLYGNGRAAIAQLGDDMVSLVPGTHKNINGANDFREAITVFKRGGSYHFTWSCDDTGSENYHVNYGTSDQLYGPITYQYPVLSKDTDKNILGTGHHDMLKIPGVDEFYIVYHRFVTPLGQFSDGTGHHRETCIEPVTFDAQTGLMNRVEPTHEGVMEAVTPEPKRGLRELYEAWISTESDHYTTESYRSLEHALAAAAAILTNDFAVLADVEDAESALAEAVAGLEEENTPVPVDKTRLEAKLAEAKQYQETKYTTESFDELKQAIAAAEAVLLDSTATQAATDAAVRALEDAVNQLVEKPAIPNPNRPSGGGSGSGSGSSKPSNSVKQYPASRGDATGWRQDTTGWWLETNANGGYAKNEWKQVDNQWYFFGADGYMVSGWNQLDMNNWYWMDPSSGAMAEYTWILYQNNWYYLGAGGAMRTGWIEDKGSWYYLSMVNDHLYGSLLTDTVTPDGYSVDQNGVWVK